MPDDKDALSFFKEFGSVFRFGSGLLGKSSIVIVALVVLGGIAIWRLRSEWAILVVFVLLIATVMIWYHRLIGFAHAHPDVALLEGGEYTAHHRMILAAKGHPPVLLDSQESTFGILSPDSQQSQGKQE